MPISSPAGHRLCAAAPSGTASKAQKVVIADTVRSILSSTMSAAQPARRQLTRFRPVARGLQRASASAAMVRISRVRVTPAGQVRS